MIKQRIRQSKDDVFPRSITGCRASARIGELRVHPRGIKGARELFIFSSSFFDNLTRNSFVIFTVTLMAALLICVGWMRLVGGGGRVDDALVRAEGLGRRGVRAVKSCSAGMAPEKALGRPEAPSPVFCRRLSPLFVRWGIFLFLNITFKFVCVYYFVCLSV